MSFSSKNFSKIAVIIPCYRVSKHIIQVISRIPQQIDSIYVVDDCCPEESGKLVQEAINDPRVKVIFHIKNQGVGAAMVSGYKKALEDGNDIFVKIDGDGQMNPGLIPYFVTPLINKVADYTKGNRFYDIEKLGQMPLVRLMGNAVLSFINKVVSGYWSVMDPTNGYTAINKTALNMIPLDKLSNKYFFESDMLFRLGTIKAVVLDIPMEASYGQEESSLSIQKVLFQFPFLYCSRFFKRILYSYFLRDFSIASLQFVIGILLFSYGIIFGAITWYHSSVNQVFASTGTVMLASLPIIVGMQLILSAISFDMSNQPTVALSNKYLS